MASTKLDNLPITPEETAKLWEDLRQLYAYMYPPNDLPVDETTMKEKEPQLRLRLEKIQQSPEYKHLGKNKHFSAALKKFFQERTKASVRDEVLFLYRIVGELEDYIDSVKYPHFALPPDKQLREPAERAAKRLLHLFQSGATFSDKNKQSLLQRLVTEYCVYMNEGPGYRPTHTETVFEKNFIHSLAILFCIDFGSPLKKSIRNLAKMIGYEIDQSNFNKDINKIGSEITPVRPDDPE